MPLRARRQEFERRAQLLRECLCSEDFLANKGIGNEIGFHTFCYDPALEFEARALFDTLSRDAEAGKLPCTLKVVNLYDAVLAILEKRRVLKAIPRQEERRGTQRVLEDVAKFCSPEKIAAFILEQTEPHAPGDVILLTGAGEVLSLFSYSHPSRLHASRFFRPAGDRRLSRQLQRLFFPAL